MGRADISMRDHDHWPRPAPSALSVTVLSQVETSGLASSWEFFLELNGYQFTATEEDAAQAVLSVAARTMTEVAFAQFLRDNTRV